jgi:hypothetical protein
MQFGRLRGGQVGYGPFERDRGTNPFGAKPSSDEANTVNYPSNGPSEDLSKFNSDSPSEFVIKLFSPVNHNIPLDTLINVHFLFILIIFFLVLGLLLLLIYLFINLLILFNKDYFLTKINNKYVLMYAKYVIFKSRVDIFILGFFILGTLCVILYSLHYLIVHPIIIN